MINSLSLAPQHSFLAKYRLSETAINKKPAKKGGSIWTSVEHKAADPRTRSLRMILSQGAELPEQDAAEIKAELAISMLQAGKNDNALKLANQSLSHYANQWAAHRVKIEIMMARQQYEETYEYISSIKVSGKTPAWDTLLTTEELHLCAASCQWRMKAWDKVIEHLQIAFPKGVKSMPRALQEDWFRLALYRHEADDAAEAASALVSNSALEFTDALLQTLVQQGWTEKALPLYRNMFTKSPKNELLRRRLVALCIREGEIEEARKLTEPGALNLNL